LCGKIKPKSQNKNIGKTKFFTERYFLMIYEKQKKILGIVSILAVPLFLIFAASAGWHEDWLKFGLFLTVAIIVSGGNTYRGIDRRFDEIKEILQEMRTKEENKTK
jgi:hypothetical protein